MVTFRVISPFATVAGAGMVTARGSGWHIVAVAAALVVIQPIVLVPKRKLIAMVVASVVKCVLQI